MQQAAQEGRQFMGRDYIRASPDTDLIGSKYPTCSESGPMLSNAPCA